MQKWASEMANCSQSFCPNTWNFSSKRAASLRSKSSPSMNISSRNTQTIELVRKPSRKWSIRWDYFSWICPASHTTWFTGHSWQGTGRSRQSRIQTLWRERWWLHRLCGVHGCFLLYDWRNSRGNPPENLQSVWFEFWRLHHYWRDESDCPLNVWVTEAQQSDPGHGGVHR